MGIFGDLWNGLIRAEHQLERAIGLHPAADATDEGEAAVIGASSGGTAGTGPRMALAPRAGNPVTAARIKRTGELLSRYWPELSGESGAMPPQALELALAQSGLESVYGGGWTDKTAKGQGDMRGSNNLGARQCGAHDEGAGPWRCVPYGDSRPPTPAEVAAGKTSNTAIPASFRYFTDGQGRSAEENGAYYFLRDLLKTWPVKEQLLSGDAGAYAHRLGPDKARGGLYYYGGFGATMAEREGSYVKALAARLPEVAAALGHARVFASVPAVSAGGVHAAASDARIAGIGDDFAAALAELGRALVRGEHEVERRLGFGGRDPSPLAAALDGSKTGGTSTSSSPGLSDRRKKALDIVAEVVPSRYGDARFKRMAPGYRVEGGQLFDGANKLPEHFTTCGYLPGFVGSRLGLAKSLSSYGTEGLRTNAKAWGAWVTPGEGRAPKPGDAYALAGPQGGIVHVGVFIARNPDGSWHTADAGQGSREAQEARFVDRPYDPQAQTLGGPVGPRALAGWVDLDAVPSAPGAADVRIAGVALTATLDPIAWWPIHVAGYAIQTTTEPISSGGHRLPMSFAELLRIARENRALPITRAVSDARWAQAQNRTIVNPLNDPRGAVFDDPKQIAAYSARVGPIGTVLRDGGWKSMIASAALKAKGPGSMIFYGWRLPDGSTIQHGIRSDHDRAWIEYDQFGDLMKRDAIDPQGNPVDLLKVLADGGSPLMDGKLPAFLVAELGGL